MKMSHCPSGVTWAGGRAPGPPKYESAGGAVAQPARLRLLGLRTPGEVRGPQTYQESHQQAWELLPLSHMGTDHTCASWPIQGHKSHHGPEISHGHIGPMASRPTAETQA